MGWDARGGYGVDMNFSSACERLVRVFVITARMEKRRGRGEEREEERLRGVCEECKREREER
jgi:hypothetical protein